MPGTGLLRLARAWFDEGTVTHVFEPLIADWQHELPQARAWPLLRRVPLHARWHVAFWVQCVRCLMSRERRSVDGRVVGTFFTTAAAASILSSGAFLLYVLGMSPNLLNAEWTAMLGFLTWNLMILMPLAVLPATMLALNAGATSRQTVGLVIGGLIGVVVVVGWLGPIGERVRRDGNEAMRTREAVREGRALSDRERQPIVASRTSSLDLAMTLPELWHARNSSIDESPRAVAELNRRAALLLLTVVLAGFGAGLMRCGAARSTGAIFGWWLGTTAGMLGVWYLATVLASQPLWMRPWVVLLAVTIAAALPWLASVGPTGTNSAFRAHHDQSLQR